MYKRQHHWGKANIEIFVITEGNGVQAALWTYTEEFGLRVGCPPPNAVTLPRLTTTSYPFRDLLGSALCKIRNKI
jgi:hypothetical protein